VNSASATVCIWCHRPFPEHKAGALVPVSPVAEVLGFLPRRTSGVIGGAVVLAALGALGYYGYRLAFDEPPPGAASTEPAPAGARDAAADAKSADGPSPTPLAAPVRAAANPPRAGRQPVELQEGKAAAAVTRTQTTNAGKPGEPGPARQEACTEALVALGLCATKPGASKAALQEPYRAPACTAAAAALGLCPPGTTQRRE